MTAVAWTVAVTAVVAAAGIAAWFCWVINDDDRTAQVVRWLNQRRRRNHT